MIPLIPRDMLKFCMKRPVASPSNILLKRNQKTPLQKTRNPRLSLKPSHTVTIRITLKACLKFSVDPPLNPPWKLIRGFMKLKGRKPLKTNKNSKTWLKLLAVKKGEKLRLKVKVKLKLPQKQMSKLQVEMKVLIMEKVMVNQLNLLKKQMLKLMLKAMLKQMVIVKQMVIEMLN